MSTSVALSAVERDEALAWLVDCVWADMEPEDFGELSDGQIRRGVARHYEGGWDAFLADGMSS